MSARACIIPVFVPHRGCKHRCVFCDQQRISGEEHFVTAEDVSSAITEAAALLPKGAERQLAFYGGSFTAIPVAEQEELLGAAKAAIDEGKLTSIRLSTRPDAIDETVLQRLKAYGVTVVELGAQSMDERVLALTQRGHSAEDVVRAAEAVKAAGFELILQMMTGLPGSSRETDIETARRLIALHPDGVRIYPTVVVRGTALCEQYRKGEYREHTVDAAVQTCADLVPLFEEAHIPILRLGLNPTEELSGGEAVAGAYHPALGELVRAELYCRRAEELLRGIASGSCVELHVHPKRISQMTGQHKCNLRRLQGGYSLKSLRVVGDLPDLEDIQVKIR